MRAAKPTPAPEVEAPKIAMANLAPAVLKPLPGGARPVLIHTGDFGGSSAVPTVNAPIQKVQTGGFGDPNGLKPSDNGKPGGKLVAAAAGGFDMPVGHGVWERIGRSQRNQGDGGEREFRRRSRDTWKGRWPQ